MRNLVIALALCACGGRNDVRQMGSTGPAQYTLTVHVQGSGVIAAAGQTCAGDCAWTLPAGATQLTATPDAGWLFDGWSNGCTGGVCGVKLAGDLEVSAAFRRGQHTLTVAVAGLGRVVSAPAGIDCPGACAASFDDGTQVTLTATAASEWQLANCTGGCVASMAADQSVSVQFTQKPADPCSLVMPKSLPAPISFSLGGIGKGFAADNAGDFVVLTAPDWTSDSLDYHFMRVTNGAAQEVRDVHIDAVNTANEYLIPRYAVAQPAGFHVFRSQGATTVFDAYDGAGNQIGSTTIDLPLGPGQTSESSQAIAVPTGGEAVIRYVWSGEQYTLHYGRYDATGAAVALDVPIDMSAGYLVTWNVDTAGNVLLVATRGRPFNEAPASARWLDAKGVPLTPWFAIGDLYIKNFAWMRTGDGLFVGAAGGTYSTYADYDTHVSSARAESQPAPQWLNDRDRSALAVEAIGGKGFLVAPTYAPGNVSYTGACGANLEVLASDGTSCGCLAVPDQAALVGSTPDGSPLVSTSQGLIVFPQVH